MPRQFLAMLEDTMGSGKTEAGLTMASRAIARGSSRGLFCGLPTTATTDAQADRQRRYYRLLFGADAAPSMTTAHSLMRPGTALQDGASCAEWISDDRRRRMLADVCVGTVDQALLAALPARFAAVRLFGLAGKLLVLDEVHSYDAYTSTLIASLLKLHAALGGSAVLLSATLRAETKLALARAFCQGAVFAEPTLSDISNPAYPLVTMVGPEGVAFEEPQQAWRAPQDKRVRLVHSEAEARETILACVRAGGCAAWIRNTVDATVAAGRALVDQHGDVTVFHARFPEADRERIQTGVLGRFGKEAPSAGRRGGIVVATAVIEQSLDLDFDLVVIDLKPMDALAQALGRALRHLRDEAGNLVPEAKGAVDGRPPREMLVLSPDPDDVIDGRWYGRLLGMARFVHRDPAVLWRTARILARERVISYGNLRKLIEEAYDEEAAAPACLNDQSEHAYGEDLGKRSAAFGLARGFSPDLGYDRQDGFWDDLKVPTRDGDAVEVVLVRIEAGVAVPYEGADWSSGRMRLPLPRIRKMSNDAADDPRLSAAIKSCKFALLVPMEARGAALTHDGTVIDPCLCTPDQGLSWTN
jgi:CRISPR-associated endonuclease/helicase Cas3